MEHTPEGSQRHYHFGYKAHLSVDTGTRLIREALLTGAKTNETVAADELICGDRAVRLGQQGP